MPIPPRRLAAMVRAYEAGKTLEQIGERFGYGFKRVHKILKRAGVRFRPPGPSKGKILRGKDLTKRRFGLLRVVSVSAVRKRSGKKMCWECKCKCGKTTHLTSDKLTSGEVTSCGCNRHHMTPEKLDHAMRMLKIAVAKRTKHGESYVTHRSKEYSTWLSIKWRCSHRALGDSREMYYYYGRGIRVCQRWRESYTAFLSDVGRKPSERHSLDRIDNDRGYSCGKCADCEARGEPSNCRWATPTEQARNKRDNVRLTHRGETLTLCEWATKTGIPAHTISRRLQDGWAAERALTQPVLRRSALSRIRPPHEVLKDIWRGMIKRCHDPHAHNFAYYGGRGIQVCLRWRRSVDHFIADMGPRPTPQHSVDRFDNDGPYSPDNCRWATRAEQSANQRPRTRRRRAMGV